MVILQSWDPNDLVKVQSTRTVPLAFASARSYDGGSGAFYILLRRNEPKTPLVTPAR